MKRTTFSLAVLFTLLTLMAFSWKGQDLNYDGLLDAKSQSELLFTTDSDDLTANLSQFLASEMDQIARVDAHYGAEKEYYYTVYGQKDGQPTVQQILVSEEMVQQQEFPSLKEMGLEKESVFVYCYWQVEEDPETGESSLQCLPNGQGIICGISPDGMCIRIRIFPFGGL